ncbi:MAG: ceramidase [Hyphomicrobiaceae bacterium]|nr:ceramidase [Hyphomicrobiaceae bacterium]
MVKPCGTPGLSSWDQVSCYCERALNPDFWAEPMNAMSNLAFLFAAAFAYADFRNKRPARGGPVIVCLIFLLMTVGVGSFLFHTYATLWSSLADVIPIAVFVAAYMLLTLRWFLELSYPVALFITAFVVGLTLVMFECGFIFQIEACQDISGAFNGSMAYAPALLSLIVVGTILHIKKHPATDLVLSATCIFLVSLVFRTIDGWPERGAHAIGCMAREMGEQTVHLGTHPFWHILNAVMLYLLLRAAIEYAPTERSR